MILPDDLSAACLPCHGLTSNTPASSMGREQVAKGWRSPAVTMVRNTRETFQAGASLVWRQQPYARSHFSGVMLCASARSSSAPPLCDNLVRALQACCL